MSLEATSLLASCAIAFGGALIGGALQRIMLRDTKGNLGSAAGFPMTMGITSAASLGLAIAVLKTPTAARMAALLASYALGWCVLWLWPRRRPRA